MIGDEKKDDKDCHFRVHGEGRQQSFMCGIDAYFSALEEPMPEKVHEILGAIPACIDSKF